MVNSETKSHTTSPVVEIQEGKYAWVHEVNLFRSPSFLFLVYRIFFYIWLGISAFVIILSAFENSFVDSLKEVGPSMVYLLGFLILLITTAYLFYAFIIGGSYTVMFELDKHGISHTQLPRRFRRAKIIGGITAVAGMAMQDLTAEDAEEHSQQRQTLYTAFDKVNAVTEIRKNCTIKIRSEHIINNQIFTLPEDYDFVLDFVKSRVKRYSTDKEK